MRKHKLTDRFRLEPGTVWMARTVLMNLLSVGLAAVSWCAGAEPLSLDPVSSHYLLFRGHPTVLVGNSEHYAAVMNLDFDYIRYLDTLKAENLNVTRLFTGVYREPEESSTWGQVGNVLAPKPAAFLTPWPRSDRPGAADGLNKFDLGQWNDAYFDRLRSFVHAASERGIIVEVVLFSNYYEEREWRRSPLNSRNNINDIGDVPLANALSLREIKLLAVQDELVHKVAAELRDFDNIYYEICNEPWLSLDAVKAPPISQEWQAHIAQTLADAEASFPARHLQAQEFVGVVENADRHTSINLIRGRPLVLENAVKAYRLSKPFGINETGFRGIVDAPYRIQAWEMLTAGGAAYVGLDYSFTVGHEDGSFVVPLRQLGGGSAALRAQLGFLHSFMDSLDIRHMMTSQSIIESGIPAKATAYALANPGVSYVVYIHHGQPIKTTDLQAPNYAVDPKVHRLQLTLKVPPGSYIAKWISPKESRFKQTQVFKVKHHSARLLSPPYSEDIALLMERVMLNLDARERRQ